MPNSDLIAEIQSLRADVNHLTEAITVADPFVRRSWIASIAACVASSLAIAATTVGLVVWFSDRNQDDNIGDLRELQASQGVAIAGLCPVLGLFVTAVEANPAPEGQSPLQTAQRAAALPIMRDAYKALGCS